MQIQIAPRIELEKKIPTTTTSFITECDSRCQIWPDQSSKKSQNAGGANAERDKRASTREKQMQILRYRGWDLHSERIKIRISGCFHKSKRDLLFIYFFHRYVIEMVSKQSHKRGKARNYSTNQNKIGETISRQQSYSRITFCNHSSINKLSKVQNEILFRKNLSQEP
jgi:hypothetical protein